MAPVQPSRLDDLRNFLQAMGQDPAGNDHLPFGRVGVIHYARFFLLEPTTDLQGRGIPAELVFMADFDAPLDASLDRLFRFGQQGLAQVLGCCEGMPEGADLDECKAYFLGHAIKDSAYYVNTVGLSVDQVLREGRLRDALGDYLDANPGLRSSDPAELRRQLAGWVGKSTELLWALEPPSPPSLGWRIGQLIDLVLLPLAGLVLLPVSLVALPFWLVALRLHERSDVESTERVTAGHNRELDALEDHGPVNQFTAIGFIKRGWFRTFTARLILFLVAYGVRHIFNHANLAGVKTIHFARWTFIDSGRRVIFASNYDGSLESYMDDFIDKVAWGLNAVFSNGWGYPTTRWLLWGGAHYETAFKNYLRVHQAPTQVWFNAYPSLSALNIANNSAVRASLRGEGDAVAWLSRL